MKRAAGLVGVCWLVLVLVACGQQGERPQVLRGENSTRPGQTSVDDALSEDDKRALGAVHGALWADGIEAAVLEIVERSAIPEYDQRMIDIWGPIASGQIATMYEAWEQSARASGALGFRMVWTEYETSEGAAIGVMGVVNPDHQTGWTTTFVMGGLVDEPWQ